MSTRLKQLNIGSLWFLAAGAVAIAVYLTVLLALRAAAVVDNHEVPFTVAFAERAASVPIGAAQVPTDVTEGIVHISGLPGGIIGLVLVGEVLQSGTPIAVLVLFGIFCWRMSRGHVFDAFNARLVTASGATITLGLVLGAFVAHMGTNYVTSQLSNGTWGRIDNPSTFDWVPLTIGIGVIILGSAFEVGTRLKRETEGLV